MKLSTYILIAFSWLLQGHTALADEKIDLTTILKEEGLTGISWMTISPENGMQTGAAGYSYASDNPKPFTPDMQFHVGSVTKTVLATGILKLATEGKIDLDEAIKDYLPNLNIDNPWAETNPITMRSLLDHTAGIEDARFWQVFSEKPKANTPLIEGLPKHGLKVRTQPGDHFSYSNTGFTVAAMVIEAVTGQGYETYLDEHLLKPLGMNESTFTFTIQAGEAANPNLVWGHFDAIRPVSAARIYLRPSGQFTSTASDLAKLAKFLMSDGEGVISHDLMKARGRSYQTIARKHGLPAGYALGIARRDRHGSVGFCHTGSIIGFYAIFCFYPDEQKAFAYSVNTDSETADYSRLTAAIIERLDLNKAPSPTAIPLAEKAERLTGFYKISPTRFDLFHYIDTVFGMRWIQTGPDNKSLVLGGVQANDRILIPVGDNLFRATDRATASHVFYEKSSGETYLDEGFKSYEKVSILYVLAHFAIVGLGLLGCFIVLIVGFIDVMRKNRGASSIPAFIGLVSLSLPVPLFFMQSFMALGDLTAAGAGVALTTGLLPVFMVATIYKAIKAKSTLSNTLALWSATFVCLWWAVMTGYGQMPLMLWS